MIAWRSIKFKASDFERAFISHSEPEYWAAECKVGRAAAFHVVGKNTDLKTLYRIEKDELVCCLLVGSGSKNIVKSYAKKAREMGCTSVRFHTSRAGFAKLIEKSGFHPEKIESVWRVGV